MLVKVNNVSFKLEDIIICSSIKEEEEYGNIKLSFFIILSENVRLEFIEVVNSPIIMDNEYIDNVPNINILHKALLNRTTRVDDSMNNPVYLHEIDLSSIKTIIL